MNHYKNYIIIITTYYIKLRLINKCRLGPMAFTNFKTLSKYESKLDRHTSHHLSWFIFVIPPEHWVCDEICVYLCRTVYRVDFIIIVLACNRQTWASSLIICHILVHTQLGPVPILSRFDLRIYYVVDSTSWRMADVSLPVRRLVSVYRY